MTIVPAAQAYQPAQTAFYTASAEDKANFNKKNPILYPKSAQLEDGTLVATFERSVGDPVGQTMPIYRSTDYGTTWESLSEVQSPAVLTKGTNREAEFAKYTSAWTNPYLYVMPETVGGLSKGTLLLAAIVSGDDPYLKEQLKANPNFNRTSDDFDRKDVALALYFSTDGGKDWSFLNIIAEGSWQGSYGGPFATENTTHQNDPVWEPFLMVYDGQLVCYYSDENEFDWSTYNKETGAIQLHAENGTDPEDGGSGQILAHKTWDGVSASWGDVVVDEAGFELKGKYAGGGRAGMTTVAHTTDDKWLMTFEWWKGGESNVQYKIADNPLEFSKVDRQPIFKLSGGLSTGGSPVLVELPDGRILYNAAGSGDIWVNETGASDGTWKRYKTSVGPGYSRNMQYVAQTGRVVLLQGTFGGFNISYGEVDLGQSAGAYYQLVNKKTGLALSMGDQTNDGARIINEAADTSRDTQFWHIVKGSDGSVTLLNKAGGRALAIDGGTIASGSKLLSWVDDNGNDKHWALEQSDNGAYRLKIGDYYALGSADGAQSVLGPQATDGSDEWSLVRDPSQVAGAAADALTDVSVKAGTDPTSALPASVKVTIAGGSVEYDDDSVAGAAPITWDAIAASSYAQAGEFTVNGKAKVTLTGVDTEVPVSVKVVVSAAEPEPTPTPDPDPEPTPDPDPEPTPDPDPDPDPTPKPDPDTNTNNGNGNGNGQQNNGNNQSSPKQNGAMPLTGSDIAGLVAAGVTLLLISGILFAMRRRSKLG